jgi:hypothetical protein
MEALRFPDGNPSAAEQPFHGAHEIAVTGKSQVAGFAESNSNSTFHRILPGKLPLLAAAFSSSILGTAAGPAARRPFPDSTPPSSAMPFSIRLSNKF